MAALNNLDVMSADIKGAHLNAPCGEKIFTRLGPESGQMQGRLAIIEKALYGLKSSANAWRNHLSESLRELGWRPTLSDGDVWSRGARRDDGEDLYEHLLVCTDDLLCVSLDPRRHLEQIDTIFKLKEDSIQQPTLYLGATVTKHTFEEDPDKEYWSMGSERYVKEAVRTVESWSTERGHFLRKNCKSQFPTGYRPEVDTSPGLSDDDTKFYMSQISVLRWAVELGRIDIATEVSALSSHMALPRQGHLTALLHVFAFLKSHSRSKLVFDSSPPLLSLRPFDTSAWKQFYHDAKEKLPADAPAPRGKAVTIICFVDADHAGDHATRRSRTGILIFINRAPIIWLSKKQTSIETSSFGSEFTALKQATELVVALRWKLRMFGVPLDGPSHIRCDNQSVVTNASVPASTLKKKNNAIAFHYVRENAAAGVIDVCKESGETNLADALSKTQAWAARQRLCDGLMH